MATQKVSFLKLGLKKNTNLIPLEWGDQIIQIKEYLPISEKLELIGNIINKSLDDNNFINPARLEIYIVLEIMYAYTNINFTDKQKEDFQNLYDLIISSGLWIKVVEILNNTSTKELEIIKSASYAVIDEIYKYKNSAQGILRAVTEDYSNLDLDATKLQEKIGNKENVEFLKEVMDKMG